MSKTFKTNEIFAEYVTNPALGCPFQTYEEEKNMDVVSYMFYTLSKMPPEEGVQLSIKQIIMLENVIYSMYDFDSIPEFDNLPGNFALFLIWVRCEIKVYEDKFGRHSKPPKYYDPNEFWN